MTRCVVVWEHSQCICHDNIITSGTETVETVETSITCTGVGVRCSNIVSHNVLCWTVLVGVVLGHTKVVTRR